LNLDLLTYFIFYLNARIAVAVEEEDTAAIKPGMNPDAETNVTTEPSTVFNDTLPCPPTYKPPAKNPN
jgi:hypothetical protein